jgi:hypothetical protein
MSISVLTWKEELVEALSNSFYGQDFEDSIHELVSQYSNDDEDKNRLIEAIDSGINAASLGDESLLKVISSGNIYAPNLDVAKSFLEDTKKAYLRLYEAD